MINYKPTKSSIKCLKSGDTNFRITDGVIVTARAGFEISNSCPYEYKMVINECLRNGWLKPVAYVHENDLLLDTLKGIHINDA